MNIEVGDICDYSEGCVHAVVRVLDIVKTESHLGYTLDPIQWHSPECLKDTKLTPFQVSFRDGYYGWCWRLDKK